MKIKVAKDLYVDSRTLVRFKWKKFYPVLIIHEKYEKILKWILRIIAFVGIATSVISIEKWYFSLGLAIIIFLIEQFFEKALFEYTTFVLQPFPSFEIDAEQWKTNGFMIPDKKGNTVFFGPAYVDREYGINFFEYMRSWINNDSNDDTENNLVVSFVIEENEKYTTYLYADFERKRLKGMFDFLQNQSKFNKYGKRQQKFIAQMLYWNTLDFKEGYFIKKFLDILTPAEPYILLPCIIDKEGNPMQFLFDYGIRKYEYKLRNRKDLTENDPEYHFIPKMYSDQ
jgi:hypothetical protein